jgi:hypothetical protein
VLLSACAVVCVQLQLRSLAAELCVGTCSGIVDGVEFAVHACSVFGFWGMTCCQFPLRSDCGISCLSGLCTWPVQALCLAQWSGQPSRMHAMRVMQHFPADVCSADIQKCSMSGADATAVC